MQQAVKGYDIALADADEVHALIEVDKAASSLFAPTGLLSEEALQDHVPADILTHATEHGDLFVARCRRGHWPFVTLRASPPPTGSPPSADTPTASERSTS